MLNIGGWELMIILLVALVFLGPTRLPEVARQIGQTVNTLRGLARGFQAELEAAARPDPLPAAQPSPTERLADKARAVETKPDDQLQPQSDGGPVPRADEEE